MVTRKSGSPSPISAVGSKAGSMKVREERLKFDASGCAIPLPKAMPSPTKSTARTASAGLTSRTTRKMATSGSTRPGAPCALWNTPTTNWRSTPASMAAAMEVGMRSIERPNGLMRAASTMRAPASRKEPTAAWTEMPVEAAMSAAPGVDQAVMTGIR
jgi:hypothetical protein